MFLSTYDVSSLLFESIEKVLFMEHRCVSQSVRQSPYYSLAVNRFVCEINES